MKHKCLLVLITFFTALLAACAPQSNTDTAVAVAVALTQTAAAPAVSAAPTNAPAAPAATTPAPTVAGPTAAPTTAPAAAAKGLITGVVQLMAPPTPPMVVYAMDMVTGAWVSAQTQQTDKPAPFSLPVPPGSYLVFAAVASGQNVGLGYYDATGQTLGTVTVSAGQTVANIVVGPPSPFDCGVMVGFPPSPDGRFQSTAPAADCLATQAANVAKTTKYEPVDLDNCQAIQELATQALTVTFTLQADAPFTDTLSNETGRGCTLIATGTGRDFANPGAVKDSLVSAMIGWDEQPKYQADGPTGTATAMTRQMGLMLIGVQWVPAPEAKCPSDQPISACKLTPEQKLYTVTIEAAQK
jgi:hypothetical protein